MLLSNRFWRLFTTLLIAVGLGLLSWLVLPLGCTKETLFTSNFLLFPAFTIAAGFLFQILGDLLRVRFLDGTFGTLLKRIVFILVSLAILVLSLVMSIDLIVSDGKALFQYGPFTYMVASAYVLMGPATCFVYLFGTSFDWSYELCPFFLPIGYAIGFILGVIDGLIGFGSVGFANVFALLLVLAIGVGMGFYYFKVNPAFSGEGYAKDESPATNSNSYSAPVSSSSRYRSSSSYHNSSSSSHSSSTGDTRKVDKAIILNELNSKMSRIASNYSRSITYNSDYVDVHVYSHVYGHEIVFEVNTRLCMNDDGDRDRRSMEYMSSLDYLKQAVSDLPSNIRSDASSAIDDLRSEYQNYDGSYRIRVTGVR